MNIILFEKDTSYLPIKDERAKHILTVLKLKENDSFKAGVINSSEGTAVISSINEEGISFEYREERKPSLYPVTMIIAQVRPICMKRILREAVSLGCGKIILTGSDTGEKSYMQSNIYKSGEYVNFLYDGAMQSAHAGVPEVLFAQNVEMAVSMADREASLIMLDNVTGSIPLSSAEIKEKAVLAIGPERGWSQREREIFTASGFKPMLLGSRVLRTETACSTGLAVLLSRMGLL
ncbi:MAG: 16S rRNA (uracil(1498)-N(3))-methyltransferase [Sphaerochaetaceae bacterium]|nr:16S rRNA (uracil(1498)-N(3))-methyltransferase [Sphaerochaetaceae bacterium]